MSPTRSYDVIIVGAGMAGASAACELASRRRKVLLLEQEERPGVHSTGRSAAMFAKVYGNAPVRALTAASESFFREPPAGFADQPLIAPPRGALFIAREEQLESLDREQRTLAAEGAVIERLGAAQARAKVSVLREETVAAALFDPWSADLDVHEIHQGYLRAAKRLGCDLVLNARLERGVHRGGDWTIVTTAGTWLAPVVVNAAGAWADVVARASGVPAIGITPKRRTAILFDPPRGVSWEAWPLVVDIDELFYFKPEVGKLLGSPADETPVEPQDVTPQEIDVARAADRILAATTLEIRHISHRWAGLRSFACDKTPVIGFDPLADGFFWLAGQGGYGIQLAPGAAMLTAATITGEPLPAALLGRIDPADYRPDRFGERVVEGS